MTVDREAQHLTLREAARRIGVHENTVRNWVDRGLITPIRVPGLRYQRFRADDIDQVAHQQEVASEKARRTEGTSELVDSDYLEAWAGSRRAEELLPEVVARLIEGTTGAVGVHVRTGDGIRMRGWDGLVEDSPGSPWIPAGPSAWELGTSGDPRRKADDDYQSRSAKPLEVEPSVTTFVFVTPRRWPGARQWERARRAEGRWRDVRVLDADDVAGWLRSQPATHLWFSEEVGLQPLEVRTLSQWWARFRRQIEPALPPELLLAGREPAARRLLEWLNSDTPSALFVRATSRDEATAFIAAALVTAPEGTVDALVATSVKGWERLSGASQPGVLIPYIDDPDIATAVGMGHRVIVPLPAGTPPFRGETIEVGLLDRNVARDVLVQRSSFGFAKADQLAGLARRSLASFLRAPELAATPRSSPSWAQGDRARVLACLVLAGAWASTQADQQAVAHIAGHPWQSVEDLLVALSGLSDPPFVRSGECWQVVSSDGAWAMLHHAAQPADLTRFCDKAVEILAETDPTLALDGEDRLLASVRGIRRPFSHALCEGVTQGLALLGALDEKVSDGSRGRDYAGPAVRHLLQRANDDSSGLLWRSLSPYLQLLAEAAPPQFLDGVEAGVGGDDPVLLKMFTDTERGATLGASSEHSGLLWALELLCWAPQLLSRAASALARLTEIDPRLGNRPALSLRSVFLPWIPQTGASLSSRFEVLEHLRSQYPDVAWKLLLAIMPSGYDVSSFTPRPRFQQWATTDERAPLSEWLDAIARTTTLVIEDAGQDPLRWSQLIANVADLPAEHQHRVLSALEDLPADAMENEPRTKLWQTLDDLIGQHRESPDARWALDDGTLNRLEAIAKRLEPDDAVSRYAALFDWNPHLPGVDRSDFEGRDHAATAARADAVGRILAELGFKGLERLAQASKVPEFAGVSTAELAPGAHFARIRSLLARTDELRRFAHGWVAKMASNTDQSWLDARAAEMSGWSVATQIGFLVALGAPTTRIVALVNSLHQTVQRQYWETVRPIAVEDSAIHDVVHNLLAHDRPWVAIDILSLACHRGHQGRTQVLSADQIVNALDCALSSDSADLGAASRAGYEIGQLLDYLESVGVDEGTHARFEWSFFRVLEHTRQPRALYRALSDDPRFFVDLVCRVYRPKKAPASAGPNKPPVAVAQNAWSVLRAWRPHLNEPGGIERGKLGEWVEQVRTELAARDRADIGDHQIGETLSGTLPGADGTWPAEEIRELIEDLASTNLESGLAIGVLNSRGTTTRGVYDGGAQERTLAATYQTWGEAVINRWPRTGRVLMQLADDYERQARREDLQAHALANDV